MVSSVFKNNFNTHDRESNKWTFSRLLFETLFNSRDEFLRNTSADNVVREFKYSAIFLRWKRLDFTNDLRVLTRTTRLFFMSVIEFSHLRDSLTVSNLRLTHDHFTIEFTFHTFNVNFQVKLTHTRDDSFVRFIITVYAESRIFLTEFLQRFGEVIRTGFIFRRYCQADNRIRNVHRLHRGVDFFRTESITRSTVDTEQCHDVTCVRNIDIFHLVRVHTHQTRNLNGFLIRLIRDESTFCNLPW